MNKFYTGSGLFTNLLVKYARSFNHPMKIKIINTIISFFYPNGIKLKGIYGEVLEISPYNYSGHQIIYLGSYEEQSLKLTIDLLTKTHNPVFVDIGANIGLFSLPCAQVPKITLYAIEPTAKNFWKLQQNFELNNNSTPNLHLLNVALSNTTEFSYISNPVESNDGTFRIEGVPSGKSYLTHLTTFDKIIKHYEITNIDVLKMDVEGFEGKVFEGFKLINEVRPKNIIMEFSDYVERVGYNKQEIYDSLINLGYESFMVDGQLLTTPNNLIDDNIWFKLK